MDDKRWTDADWMLAAQQQLLQLLIRIQWAGLGIKGDVPPMSPISIPRTAADKVREEAEAEEQRRRKAAHKARVMALRRFSPTYRKQQQEKGEVVGDG